MWIFCGGDVGGTARPACAWCGGGVLAIADCGAVRPACAQQTFFRMRAVSPAKSFAFHGMEEIDDEIIDFLPVFDRLFPFGGDGRQAVIGSRDLTVDGADGIGIAAQIDGGDHPVAEAFRGMEGPQGGVQRADAPAGIVDGFPRGIR